MNNEENLLEEIPKGIKRFRYENLLLSAYYDRDNSPRMIMKNTEWDYHFDFFMHDNKPGIVLTRENQRGTKNEHVLIDVEKSLQKIGEMYLEFWKLLEYIDKNDHRYVGKLVDLCTPPSLFYSKTKQRKAYIDQDIDYSTEKFEEIDLHEPRFDTISDENGDEIELLFIKNGQIFGISISKLNEMEQKFSEDSIFTPKIEQ